jgi:hypothetical protein
MATKGVSCRSVPFLGPRLSAQARSVRARAARRRRQPHQPAWRAGPRFVTRCGGAKSSATDRRIGLETMKAPA